MPKGSDTLKKILVAVISIALVVFLSFGAYADIIQPYATQFELGYSLSGAQNTITDIVLFSALPYTYNAQLMMNGNNNALYTYGLYNISGFTDSDQIATSYNFVGGQSYEVTYRFSMQFADNSLASYLEYIDPQLIGINAYFTNDPLASFTNGMPSSTIASYSSNYSAAITNETVVSSHDPNIAGTVSFDVVLLFKLNLNYSGSFHKILLNLDLHNFATAIPSGNSGFFYCQLTYQSLENVTRPGWNTLPTSNNGYCTLTGSTVASGSISTSYSQDVSMRDFISLTFAIQNNFTYCPYFMPGYSFRGNFTYRVRQSIGNGGLLSKDVGLSAIGLCNSYINLGPDSPYPITYIDSSFGLTLSMDSPVLVESNANSITYQYVIHFSFTVPSDLNLYFRDITFVFSPSSDGSSGTSILSYSNSIGRPSLEFDSSGTLLTPDDPDDPGGGGDDSGGSVDLSGIESGIDNLAGLIEGDGSYGSPESEPLRELDEYILEEHQFADEFGLESYFNDDFMDNLLDEADWSNIDTPTQDSAYWVHKILNPIMDCFPVFIIFPLIIGLVATFLGRRYQG